MNRHLDELFPYPFERQNALLADITPETNEPFIALSLGEPKHDAADFIIDLMTDKALIRRGLGTYPPTKGLIELRSSIANFIERRYHLGDDGLDPDAHVLPVSGTREALFAFAQAVIDPANPGLTLMPNPFYQIYEGAALLAGSKPYYLPCLAENGFLPDLDQVSEETWLDCKLLYLCSPGNPSGVVTPIETLKKAIRLALEYDFVIASDECYSEIYADEANPPCGLLEASAAMGNKDFKNCVAFNSLSKRSNLPGLRSGFVAGDPDILAKFLLYRTYHGAAMSVHNQLISAAAWDDENHVEANRVLYREKYAAVMEILRPVWPMQAPPASFYLWPETPISDTAFTQRLYRQANIKVLPGSFLSRPVDGINPGENRVRMALVATLPECVTAATRLAAFVETL